MRFEYVSSEELNNNSAFVSIIIRDRETGVKYLFVQKGSAGGLTPLLDANGNPQAGIILNKDESPQ